MEMADKDTFSVGHRLFVLAPGDKLCKSEKSYSSLFLTVFTIGVLNKVNSLLCDIDSSRYSIAINNTCSKSTCTGITHTNLSVDHCFQFVF